MNNLEETENTKVFENEKKYNSKFTELSEESNTHKINETQKNTSECLFNLEESFDFLSQKENFKV